MAVDISEDAAFCHRGPHGWGLMSELFAAVSWCSLQCQRQRQDKMQVVECRALLLKRGSVLESRWKENELNSQPSSALGGYASWCCVVL